MFRPTGLPSAPIQAMRYASAVVSLCRLACMTWAVWHGWMKNTGVLVIGCS